MTVWRRFEAAVDRGDVIQLGISNCYSLDTFTSLYENARHKPKVLQNRFYDDSGYDLQLRSFCHDHNVVYQTFWTLTANRHLLSTKSSPITQVARRLDVTPAQILFAWLIHQGYQPLTGTTSSLHMQQDLQASALADQLIPDEVAQITSLFSPP